MSNKPEPNASEIISALQEAIQGLLYLSESDEPFAAVSWKEEGKPLDPKRLLDLAGHIPANPVQVISLDDFFRELTQEKEWYGEAERADAQRYRKLLAVIQSRLNDPKVFRIGRIKVDIYIIGQTPEGDWAGVKTTAVET